MNNIPLFCDVCEISLNYYQDADFYRKFQCCRNCAMKWAEADRENWQKGWRPNKEEIDKYISDRISLIRARKELQYDIRTSQYTRTNS